MKKLLQSLFILVFVAGAAMAQDRTITGTVTGKDDGLPIPGVSVKIVGTSTGTSTDATGKYVLNVKSGTGSLEFSSIGYSQQVISVGSSNILNVVLAADARDLSEVVVVGYGTQLKKNVTVSISSVQADDIKDQPVPNIAQAIQGRMAGVQVSGGSGRPGSGLAINIRGRASIAAGNNPLYVVDGVILPSNSGNTPETVGTSSVESVPGLANINPEDIASVEVLKDAAAAAIYGSRGSNGVVIITTKGANKTGKSTISLSAYTGVQSLTKTIDFLNATDYRIMYNEALENAGRAPLFTKSQVENPEANVNWFDEILRTGNSKVDNIQLSVASGGTEKTQFYSSLNYFNQDGLLQNGSFKRFSLRTNITHDINDFIRLGSNIGLSKSLRDETPIDNSIFSPWPRAAVARPDQPVYGADGKFATNSFNNPLHMFESVNYLNLSNIINSTYVEVKLLPELRFKSSVGIDYTYLDQRIYNPITSLSGASSNGSATSGYVQTQNILATQMLSYNKALLDNRLNLDATAVYEFQWNDQENNRVNGTNFPSDLTPYVTSAASITGGTASLTQFRIESLLARVNLGWEGKYLVGASIRRDGSSKIPQAGRYGYFPAVSGGWVVSEESFLKDNPVVSYLKVRSSYGETGNQEGIGNYTSRRLFGGGYNYNDSPGLGLTTLGSPNLKWETTRQFDIGLEVAVLNNRVSLSADYYKKKTSDLLLNKPIPSTTGLTSILENIGNIEGKGFDFSINSKNLTGDFKWNTSFNISTFSNVVTNLFNDQFVSGSFVTRTMVGQPLGAFFVLKSLGVDPATGDMMYEDFDENGVVNDNDRQYLGTPIPKVSGGLTNNFSYKGVDLGVFFQFASGNKLYNMSAEGVGGYGSLGGNISSDPLSSAPATNVAQEVFDGRWTPTNTNAKYPRAIGGSKGVSNSQRSSRFLEDGSYLRLKNITLGYNLPKAFTDKLKIGNARVYVSGQNILTFTKYTGFDPEVSTSFLTTNTGVDQGSIPQFKTYTFGLNISL